jgi:hypothetical protein
MFLCQSEVAPNHPIHESYTGGPYIAMMMGEGRSKPGHITLRPEPISETTANIITAHDGPYERVRPYFCSTGVTLAGSSPTNR